MSVPTDIVGSGHLSDWALTRLPHDTGSFRNTNSSLASSTTGEHVSAEAGGFRVREVILLNGESYSGTLLGNVPEGSGKYVWSDGCTYDGEWRRGMRHGVGKTTWPSGAIYEGEFCGGYIHGTGTYSRPDGTIYRGRWKLNVKHGLGYEIFPNGDTFDGSWIQGEIEGPGKYTWSSGNVFIGHMKGGKMSGKGALVWGNGDMYEGSWLNGMMHGFGIYTWNDDGCYIGTWTRGLKDGKGTFYPNRNRVPAAQELYLSALRRKGLLPDMKQQSHGSRILRSSLIGMGNAKANGTQGSSGASSENQPKGSIKNSGNPRNRNISLERRWSLESAIEKALGNDISKKGGEFVLENEAKLREAIAPILEREYVQGVLINELVINDFTSSASLLSKRMKKQQKKLVKDIKRPGETIIKGHRSYDLMISLQLGIRYTVGKITPIQRREVCTTDFGPRASFWMTFPKAGSQLAPPHRAEDFKWKDYCPMVFRNLREMFKIDAADYMMSICGNEALRELSSPGKSGSVFFLSQDDRFMIKTLRKSEVKVLLKMLPDYHHHVRTYDNTLITKFFGLHRVKPLSGQKFRFVVMGNVFCTELRIHRRFDLKGSSLGRSSDKVEIDENTILKDLDLNYSFYLEPSWRDELLKQIACAADMGHHLIYEKVTILWGDGKSWGVQTKQLENHFLMQLEIDSKFLEEQRIMDYSLLLGVHYRAPQYLPSRTHHTQADVLAVVAEDVKDDDISYPQSLVLIPRGNDVNKVAVGSHIRGSSLRASSAGDEEVDLLLPGTARLQIQLGVNMPARAERKEDEERSQSFHEVYDVVLYLGIIDILQEYNLGKKIEHTYKSLQFDATSISAVDPTFYSQRFLDFIMKVFPDNS